MIDKNYTDWLADLKVTNWIELGQMYADVHRFSEADFEAWLFRYFNKVENN